MVQHRWLHSCKVHTHTHIFFHDPMTAGSEVPSSVHTGLHCKRSSRIWPNRSRKMRRGKATARAHSPIAKPEADARHKARHNRSRGRKTVTGVLIGNLLSRLYESSHLGSRQRDLCEIDAPREAQRSLCPILGSEIYTSPLWMVKIRVFCRFAGKFPN